MTAPAPVQASTDEEIADLEKRGESAKLIGFVSPLIARIRQEQERVKERDERIARQPHMSAVACQHSFDKLHEVQKLTSEENRILRSELANRPSEWVVKTVIEERDKARAELADCREALRGLVKVNEEWNSAVEATIGRPPNWTDGYLDKARAILARRKEADHG